jgi:hypothetical protein
MTREAVTGLGDWTDQVLLMDDPYIQEGFTRITGKQGLGVDLNPEAVKAHLASGESWWG